MSEIDGRPKPRLLAIDDNPDHAELVVRVAMKCGYDARSISDPLLMDQVVREWSPDVVSIDLCMPKLDGLEATALLQKQGFEGRLVIVSAQDFSIRTAAFRLAEARGLIVAGNVSKPIDKRALRELLSRLL